MKFTAFARNARELEFLKEQGVSEVILAPKSLSRLGMLELDELFALARQARTLDLRPILEWDILMTPARFSQAVEHLTRIDLSAFAAARVQDPGAFEFLRNYYPGFPIQLILETGNHNLRAIERWCEYGRNTLERVVLSIELPKASLARMIQKLPVPVEILGMGPILLLYTPRHLLSNQSHAQFTDTSPLGICATASSEERLHSGFRIIENSHGTLVFHPKDYCLIEKISELREIGLGAFRVDLRLESDSQVLAEITRGHFERFSQIHTRKLTHCFYQANATDVLFKKLKNTRVQRRDDRYLGEVVEISRDNHIIVRLLGKSLSLRKGQTLIFVNPEGEELTFQVNRLTDIDQRERDELPPGEFAVLPYLKRATPRTAVYLATTSTQ